MDGLGEIIGLFYFAVGIIIQMISEELEQDGTSLEDHLTNSIRRAKERIYSNAITNYSHYQDLSISQPSQNTSFQIRNRTNSHRNTPSSSHHKQQRNVLASAMRTLQQRISQLQRENQQLKTNRRQSLEVQAVTRKKQQREELEFSKLASRLRERQQQIKRMNRQNKDLNSNIADLLRRNRQLEEEIQKIVNKQLDFPSESNSSLDYKQSQQANIEIIHQQESKIAEQQQRINQLQQVNRQKEAAIDQLSKKLDHEKKVNMRWIKMHESQLEEIDHKQNNSLQANAVPQVSSKPHHPKRQQTNELIRKNKEMYENLQRNKNKIADLTRQCKHYEERFTEMKLISLEIVENVTKAIPHQSSHIKYLATKILKLENNHLESLRSFSNNSRKSRIMMDRNSTSKSRKRSLKMEDLNSSAKKSRQGSHSKSHKKRQPIQQEITRSQKKGAKQNLDQLGQVERQVKVLMREYRNLVARGQKDKNNEQLAKKIQQIGNQYSEMRTKYQQLKKHQVDAVKQRKQAARD